MTLYNDSTLFHDTCEQNDLKGYREHDGVTLMTKEE